MNKKINEDEIFDEWNTTKKRLHGHNRLPHFKEGELWWCGVGKNIGVEAYGKNEDFSRPMIIYHKLNKYSFIGICATSKEHSGTWYIEYAFDGKHRWANLAQIKTASANRLYRKIGELSKHDFNRIKEGFAKLYIKIPSGSDT